MRQKHRENQRRRVAQEAAELLYTEQEKEYKQAKLSAAKALGVSILPSNAEIAVELDRIAEEREGKARQKNLIRIRRKALQIMQLLENFNPILVGSVWRGTAYCKSDIDIITYTVNPQEITSALQKNNYTITKIETQTITKKGKKEQSLHIYIKASSEIQVEIVVRSPEDINRQIKCEIYGDKITGLTVSQLRQILRKNPQRRFIPT